MADNDAKNPLEQINRTFKSYFLGIGYKVETYNIKGERLHDESEACYFYATKKVDNNRVDQSLLNLGSTIGNTTLPIKTAFDRLAQEYKEIQDKKNAKADRKSILLAWTAPEKTEERYKLSIKVGPSIKSGILDIKNTIEKLIKKCSPVAVITRLEQFGKDIEPKDLASIVAKNKEKNTSLVLEAYGSSKSSYHPGTQARIIVRHSKEVDDSPGSRSRNIKALFVETSNGERRLIPTKNLWAARLVCKYLREPNANLFDEKSSALILLAEDLKKLKKFRATNVLTDYKMDNKLDKMIEFMTDLIKKLNSSKSNDYLSCLDLDDDKVQFNKGCFKDLGDEVLESYARGECMVVNDLIASYKKLFANLDLCGVEYDELAEELAVGIKDNPLLAKVVKLAYFKHKNGALNDGDSEIILKLSKS